MCKQVEISQYENQDELPMISYSVNGTLLFCIHTLDEDRGNFLKLCEALKTDVIIATLLDNGEVKEARLLDYSRR